MHELAGLAVYAGEDQKARCTHLLLEAGRQRDWLTLCTTDAGDAVHWGMGWWE